MVVINLSSSVVFYSILIPHEPFRLKRFAQFRAVTSYSMDPDTQFLMDSNPVSPELKYNGPPRKMSKSSFQLPDIIDSDDR
jgi:hypothetical protein